jgi:glycogen synthase
MITESLALQKNPRRSPESSLIPDAYLCETSWEVCNQVGGIYTVIRSKAPVMVEHWGDRYLLIGPYEPAVAQAELEELPAEGVFGQAVQALRDQGLGVYYGRWLVTGQPRVVLLDVRSAYPRLAEIKYLLWERHGIATPPADSLIDGVAAFGWMVEQFFRALLAGPGLDRPVIGHFHEWMGGSAIPEIRRGNLPLSIVFTTHATMLGRYLAMNDPWFYDHVPFVNWEGDARRFNIEAQVRIERAAAHGAHVFTTLSEITAYECEHLIGRRPDLLLPNGLNIERFVAMHEFQNLHRQYKEKIHEFVIGHFFPSYTFDLEKTVYFFSSGRYEYRNKGFDLTIDALTQLNWRLKESGTDRTVVFFLTTKRPFRSINAEALQSRGVMEELRRSCEGIKDQLGDRLFLATVMNQNVKMDDLVDEFWKVRLRRLRHSWRISRLPSIVTHDLHDDASDDVLNRMRGHGLINWPDDRVKVVYCPDFITSANPLFGMEYNQFVRGCHMGIFPSFYEPWGYTPEECLALGVPSVTSDLAGFGTYLIRNVPDHASRGLHVVHRRAHSYRESVDELTNALQNFLQLERRERIALRNRVESSSDDFDWGNLIRHYWDAYREVCRRTGVVSRGTPTTVYGPDGTRYEVRHADEPSPSPLDGGSAEELPRMTVPQVIPDATGPDAAGAPGKQVPASKKHKRR